MNEALHTLTGFCGKTALVTGAGRGIGLAVARALAQAGAEVILADVDDAAAQAGALDIATSTGAAAQAWAVDVGAASCVADLQRCLEMLPSGRVDLLVNNAGISPKVNGQRQPAWMVDPLEWQQVMAVNLSGQFHVCLAAIPGMMAVRKGAIVNIGSLAGLRYSSIAGVSYSVSKSGVAGLTRQLAGEVAEHGIRVNAVAPGRIETAMSAAAAPGVNDAVLAGTPLRRLGSPMDIAAAVLFLLSDQAGFITGQTLAVAGGRGL